MKPNKTLKIGVLGSMHTGQHNLILRYRNSSNFELNPDYDHGGKRFQLTAVKCIDIDGKMIRIAVDEVPRYRSARTYNNYYDCYVIPFRKRDIKTERDLEELDEYIAEKRRDISKHFCILVSVYDKKSNIYEEMNYMLGYEIARKHGMMYGEVDIFTGMNVEFVFESLARAYLASIRYL